MARPERQLDVTRPLHAFAAELRKLRVAAGEPKYLAMARKVGDVSRTALSEAAGGDHLPTWHTVEKFVQACNGDPSDWRQRWEQLREEIAEPSSVVTKAGGREAPSVPVDLPLGSKSPPPRRRRALLWGSVTVVTLGAATAAGLASLQPARTPEPVDSSSAARVGEPVPTGPVVVIQNMIAIGGDDMIEDPTPAYLSARTVPRCRLTGCMIPNTILITGTTAVATCHATGTLMTNYNRDSTEVQRNPNRARSTLWYRLVLPDGRAGFLSEVYVTPASRGGLGLPTCPADVQVSTP